MAKGRPVRQWDGWSGGWEQSAACRGADASLFFGPNRFEPKGERDAREAAAKAICEACPVIDPCRETSLVQAEAFGVWGGLGELERRVLLAGMTEKVG